jgi:dihydrofolate synthase/folylpolyglutamate synthase
VTFDPADGGGSQVAPDRLDRPFDDPLFDRLFPPLPTGVHWGLERVRAALADLDDPHLRVPSLHVGGTNGKGSVASTAAAILLAAGRRAALFTSPHLCSVAERFQVDGRPLSPEVLVGYAEEIRGAVVTHGLTFFEASTVLAFHAFAGEGAEIMVVEVGLGGRLDATNVLSPLACALTNVQRDHAEYLGDTLPAIAREKAGIIKPGVPAVTAEIHAPQLDVFRAAAERAGTSLRVLDPGQLEGLEVGRRHTAFSLETRAWGRLRLTTPLLGRHQATNAALAVALVEALPPALRPDADAVRGGVAGVRWPGRDQIEVVDGRTWLLDVAHNTAGIRSLVELLDRLELPAPRVAVVGVLGDKEWGEMLPPLLGAVSRAVLTQPRSAPPSRRWNPEEARSAVAAGPGAPTCPVEVRPELQEALRRAREIAGAGTVVVTGSCYTVGDALAALGRVPFAPDAL